MTKNQWEVSNHYEHDDSADESPRKARKVPKVGLVKNGPKRKSKHERNEDMLEEEFPSTTDGADLSYHNDDESTPDTDTDFTTLSSDQSGEGLRNNNAQETGVNNPFAILDQLLRDELPGEAKQEKGPADTHSNHPSRSKSTGKNRNVEVDTLSASETTLSGDIIETSSADGRNIMDLSSLDNKEMPPPLEHVLSGKAEVVMGGVNKTIPPGINGVSGDKTKNNLVDNGYTRDIDLSDLDNMNMPPPLEHVLSGKAEVVMGGVNKTIPPGYIPPALVERPMHSDTSKRRQTIQSQNVVDIPSGSEAPKVSEGPESTANQKNPLPDKPRRIARLKPTANLSMPQGDLSRRVLKKMLDGDSVDKSDEVFLREYAQSLGQKKAIADVSESQSKRVVEAPIHQPHSDSRTRRGGVGTTPLTMQEKLRRDERFENRGVLINADGSEHVGLAEKRRRRAANQEDPNSIAAEVIGAPEQPIVAPDTQTAAESQLGKSQSERPLISEEIIASFNSLKELTDYLKTLPTVKESRGAISGIYLAEHIEKVAQGKPYPIEAITRNYGLRQKVWELIVSETGTFPYSIDNDSKNSDLVSIQSTSNIEHTPILEEQEKPASTQADSKIIPKHISDNYLVREVDNRETPKAVEIAPGVNRNDFVSGLNQYTRTNQFDSKDVQGSSKMGLWSKLRKRFRRFGGLGTSLFSAPASTPINIPAPIRWFGRLLAFPFRYAKDFFSSGK